MRRLLAVLLIPALLAMAGCDGVTSLTESDLTGDDTASPELALSKQENTSFPQFAGTGNYYATVASTGITWSEARDAAAAMERYRGCTPHLATLTSQEENDFVFHNFEQAWWHGYWLGGYQPEGNPDLDAYRDQGWAWVTGEPFVFTNWAPLEPNDAPYDEWALHFSGPYSNSDDWHHDAGGTWNDLLDDEIRVDDGYVVEWSCDKEVSKVTGSAHLHGSGGYYKTFSFTAIGNVDGTAKGQWQLYNRGKTGALHGTVECVVVVGNEAWFAGPITHAEDPSRIGDIKAFMVVDNGESGLPDRTSRLIRVPFSDGAGLVINSAQGWCAHRPSVDLSDTENGNIQVH